MIDLRKPTATTQPQVAGLTRCRLPLARTRADIAARYPNLLRAMRGVAILCQDEATGALDSLILHGMDCAGEAVNHYGGCLAVVRQAWRFRANYRPNPADDLTCPTSEVSIAWLISETFTQHMETTEANPKNSRFTRLESAYSTTAAHVASVLNIRHYAAGPLAVSYVMDILQRWVTDLTPSFPGIATDHRQAAREIQRRFVLTA